MRFLIGVIVAAAVCAVAGQAIAAEPAAIAPAAPPVAPVRMGIVGLVHGHVAGFLGYNLHRADVQVVGIAEPDQKVAGRYAEQFHLDKGLMFAQLDEMLDKTHPQAVLCYTNTFDHRAVVEACARRGIHVMMEKPLAVSLEDARAIEKAAREGKIYALVNYETTWYPCNRVAFELTQKKSIGDIRKIVAHDGHRGPKEIGVPPEFSGWLSDPKLNGAGALFDFGCYGADLATWLFDNQRPLTVTAVTQQIKPDVYPHVDDEATIILTYPKAQVILQASWNWPFDRKDLEIYGQKGSILTVGHNDLNVRHEWGPEQITAKPNPAPYGSSVSYFRAVVAGEIKPDGPSSLETNVIVTEILDAARQSAATGKTVTLPAAK